MINTPLVSVIIPNYNHSLFLKQRVESVLNQTHQNFELIILDDFSCDKSKEIIEQYRNNPKVSHIVYNQENSGSVFKQWIKGIELSAGEYVWIAESDDYASEIFLQKTLSALKSNELLGMTFTRSNKVNVNGEPIKNTSKEKENSFGRLSDFDNVIQKENAPLFLVSQMVILNASSVLFRKAQLLKLDLNELSQFRNTGDRFTYLGIALNSRILYLPEPLNYMRLHDNNTTKKNLENGNIHRDRLRVVNYYFEQLSVSEHKKELGKFYKTNYFFFINYCTYPENLKLLVNIKRIKEISTIFYLLVRFYIFLFVKKKINARAFRSVYYRFLLIQK